MQLKIEKLIYGGDGLARLPADDQGRGKAVFIPFVLESETVDVSLIEQKPGFARGSMNSILLPSKSRIEPPCPYFLRCGGCHYQHSNYQHQLDVKADILRENLRRIAKLELDVELKVHPSPEWGYRNRSRFTVQFQPEFALCYHRFNSHQLLPVEECPISSPLINQALKVLWNMGRSGEFAQGVQEIEIFAAANDATCLIEANCGEDLSTNSAEKWALNCQNRMPEIAGVVVSKGRCPNSSRPAKNEFISTGNNEIKYETSNGSYRVSARSFFQVNRHLIDELVNIVTDQRSGITALDLYAGVGLFSSVLNRDFQRVIAVEASPTSYADLLYNSAPNVKAVRSTTEQYLKNELDKTEMDLVVADPPRSGLGDAVTRSLVALRPPRITYVSCDPATAARDLRVLLGGGYKLQQVHLIDLFPQTFHIESVFELVR